MGNLKNNTIVSDRGGVLLPAPRKSRPERRERFWLVRCNFCGNVRWLRKSDIRKDAPCRSCSAVINSTTSSEIEESVADFLSKHNVEYDRHVPVIDSDVRYSVDFYLPKHDLYVEVIGYWHEIVKHAKDNIIIKKIQIVFVNSISDIRDILIGLGIIKGDI